ncbi:MAG: FtsW/RodA/SpoVE family cell cycle protein [Muribaculaceae bacterium]|nr:FtsW/RodA/SpoVE family cell cycle protein [Muribaculaceae bacterium]
MNDLLTGAAESALAQEPDFVIPEGRTASARSTAESAPAVKQRKRIDYHMWGTYLLLVMIATLELFSASIQEVREDDIFEPIIRHGRFIVGGLVLMLILQAIHYRWLFKLIPLYVLFSVGIMVAVLVGGGEINGAARAIRIMGVPVLPAEFMKLAVALGMAWLLARFQIPGKRDITTWGVVACLVFLGTCAVLLFSQGLSNTIIVVSIGLAMMFVGGIKFRKFCIILGVIAVAGGIGYIYKTKTKAASPVTERQELINKLNHIDGEDVDGQGRGRVWNNRMSAHFRPNKWAEPFSTEHQQEQLSFIAQARGGITGSGVGKSRENARLPLAYSDYVYAIIIEETGLIGGLGVLLIYLWILGRSAKLTLIFRHTMPGVMVMGCAFVIVFQALYHMAIVSGVFPVSGQPLPLISKGGISVIAISLAFGVMLSCARHAVHNSDSVAAQKKESDLLPDKANGLNLTTPERVD